MKAIELKSKTDHVGHLKIDFKLDKKSSNVRIIILYDESNENKDEKLWMKSISSNPAFDFLNDPSEDVYSITDGEPLND
nr:hypothetical protein [Bacteroidota bacterium]